MAEQTRQEKDTVAVDDQRRKTAEELAKAKRNSQARHSATTAVKMFHVCTAKSATGGVIPYGDCKQDSLSCVECEKQFYHDSAKLASLKIDARWTFVLVAECRSLLEGYIL
jgi:hypothetical protein